MISVIGHSSVNCLSKDKNSSKIHPAWIATAIVIQLLLASAGTILFFKGVGIIPAAVLWGSPLIMEAAMLISFTIKTCKKRSGKKTTSEEKPIKETVIVPKPSPKLTKKTYLVPKEIKFEYNEKCDRFTNVLPNEHARVHLADNTPTNGAQIWNGDILISGPDGEDQANLLWRIVDEEKASVIVRIGEDSLYGGSCIPYTPKDSEKRVVHEDLSILGNSDTKQIRKGVERARYTVTNKDGKRDMHLFALTDWPDHDVWDIEALLELIQAVEEVETGPVIAHCKGGRGRAATFLACRYIYQLFKQNNKSLDVEGEMIIKELRRFRTDAVEEESGQWGMVKDFIKHLQRNSKSL